MKKLVVICTALMAFSINSFALDTKEESSPGITRAKEAQKVMKEDFFYRFLVPLRTQAPELSDSLISTLAQKDREEMLRHLSSIDDQIQLNNILMTKLLNKMGDKHVFNK